MTNAENDHALRQMRNKTVNLIAAIYNLEIEK